MGTNVLVLTIDSLRYDTIVDRRVEAPTIRSLEADGVAFERAFATGPGTTPSFPAILTGTLPLSYGGLGPLRSDRPRMSAQFQAAGFATGGFQSNPFLSRHFNYDVGFDRYEDYQNPLMGVATKVFPRGIEIDDSLLGPIDDRINLTGFLKWSYEQVRGKPRPYVSAEVISDDTVAWLETVDEPFFGWAHYMDVHQPCYPPSEFRARFDVDGVTQSEASELYSRSLTPGSLSDSEARTHRRLADAAVAYTDHQIGRIVQTLRDRGLYEDTLIVLTSDHGHLYGDHGEFGKPERMYDELLQVPLIVANGPDSLESATGELVSLLDLPPTIHDAMGLAIPEAYEGRVIARDQPRQYILAEHEVDGDPIVGARDDSHIYEHDAIQGEDRLLSLSDGSVRTGDRDELADAPLRSVVDSRLAENETAGRVYDGIDDDTEQRLEELGYL